MLTAFLSILLSIFTPPVDYDISLAGNFGEPRPNHFHGGLDIRTEGREGKHIYAIGDGYVSRITDGLYGFGKAVYITHPTGQTSVYCHLKSFSPRIKAALRRFQYSQETSVADAHLTPLDCPVSQGQFIALSGNTGSSTAPHLHLEIHDTRTWDMLDPYEFLTDYINDTIPPRAHGIMACPQDPQSYFNGRSQSLVFNIHADNTAWGRVGFAIWADDYMQDSYNHYGVRETQLLVDGKEVFNSIVDRIPVSQNRLVNSWGDYDHWLHHRTWYMRSFKEPGNTLAILHTDESRGIIDFSDERDYHLEYILCDYKGNESRYAFTVQGKAPQTIKEPGRNDKSEDILHWNQTCTYNQPGMQLVVPYGLLTRDIQLRPTVRENLSMEAYSDAYSFYDRSLPLVTDAIISLYVQRPVEEPSKLYVTSNGRFLGGDYKDGWVTGKARDLGHDYELDYDDEPPVIKPMNMVERLQLSVHDTKTGIASWTATIDGRFVVFDAIEKSSTYACDLRETWLRKTGKTHRLRFVAIDHRDNTQTFETTFHY